MFYISLIFYFFIIIFIAIVSYFLNKNLSDFLLANKNLSAPVIGIGAGTADMSGWLMMGLPGAIFIFGVNQIWIIIGLLLGAFCNWHFVAKRLRTFTGQIEKCLTVPCYLNYRFNDKKGHLSLLMSLVMIIFFTFYSSAGFIAAARVLEFCFSISYLTCLLIVYFLIIFYIVVGGFFAINWIDFFQGTMILMSLIILPYIAFSSLGGIEHTISIIVTQSIHYSNILYKTDYIMIISSISWGLGYFGQPHILVRFMAINDKDDINLAKIIGILWMFLALSGALFLGFVSIPFFSQCIVKNPENIFIEMVNILYKEHFLEGIMIGALLSAIISTISAQIIGATSALVEDIYHKYFRKKASNTELLKFSRLSIFILCSISLLFALQPNSSILSRISFAWAGMGSAFGPLILISLFYSKVTKIGGIAGIISGFTGAFFFPYFDYLGGWFAVYEIFPGFFISSFCIIFFSMLNIKYKKKFHNVEFSENLYYKNMKKALKGS